MIDRQIVLRRLLGAIVSAPMLSYVPTAYCQSTSGDPGDAASEAAESERPDAGLDEIIVTAQRREQRLQDIPVSVTAVDGEALKTYRVTELAQIGKMVPGLFIQSSDLTRPTTYIRGVGNRQFDAGSEGSVGFFFDDLYLGRTSGQLAGLFDLERIEVLRGPQGALFGRNTIGGAISIVSAKPTTDFGGCLQADVGNFDLYRVEGAVTGALDDAGRISGRLALVVNRRDGYFKNSTTGNYLQGDDMTAARARLRLEPADAWTLDLTAEIADTDAAGVFFTRTGAIVSASPWISLPPDSNRREEPLNQDAFLDRKVYTGIARAEWAANLFDVVGISGYRGIRSSHQFDFDGSPFDTLREDEIESSNAYSQEVRLQSQDAGFGTFGGKLEWLFGGIYYRENTRRTDHLLFGPDSAISSIIRTFDETGVVAPLLPGFETFDAPFTNDVTTKSLAFFGQGRWKFSDRFNVTGALRWTRDEKGTTISLISPRPGLPPAPESFAIDLNPSWSSVDGKLTVDYRILLDAMVFATVAKGSKSGGFQFATFDPVTSSVVFGPENLYAYEIGIKASLFGRLATFNATAFYYDYKDQQLLGSIPTEAGAFSVAIVNAGSSTIKGGEMELQIAPVGGLRLSGSYAYLDARYDKFLFAPGIDNAGNAMPRAPKHMINISADATTPLGGGEGFVHVDWNWQSKFYFEFDEGLTPFSTQNAFGLLNAHAGYQFGRWRATAWAKNLTDETYTEYEVNLGASIHALNAPRSYGVGLGVRF